MAGWTKEFTFKAISDTTGHASVLTVWARYERMPGGGGPVRMAGRITTDQGVPCSPVEGEKGAYQVGGSGEILRSDDPKAPSNPS